MGCKDYTGELACCKDIHRWVSLVTQICCKDSHSWVSLLHKQQLGIKGLVCAFNLFVCLIWGTFTVHVDINTQKI